MKVYKCEKCPLLVEDDEYGPRCNLNYFVNVCSLNGTYLCAYSGDCNLVNVVYEVKDGGNISNFEFIPEIIEIEEE
jgi:hypothetical protein